MRTIDFIALLKQLYVNRDARRLALLMDTMFDETKPNVMLGTAFGKLCFTQEERTRLFEDDIRYWDDLLIDDSTCETASFGRYTLLTVQALSLPPALRKPREYDKYIAAVKDIAANEERTAYQRALEIEWLLSGALLPDALDGHTERKPVALRMILEGSKARLVCFSYEKTLAQSDAIYNWGDIRARYDAFLSMTQFETNNTLAHAISKDGYQDVHVKMLDDGIFFGVALASLENRGERLAACMNDMDRGPDLWTLFDVRRELAFTLMQYADDIRPKAVVRFFGVCDGPNIECIQYCYPNY